MLSDDGIVTNPMSSLSECLTRASEEGFNETFVVLADKLMTEDEINSYHPEDVKIEERLQFEGKTARGGDSLVYLIETKDGKRGTLIDAFGPYCNTKLAAFIRSVDHHQAHHRVKERRTWKEFLQGY